MLKRLLLMVLTLILMGGCAVNVKRGVKDNVFYSTYPELALEMASEFEYVESGKSNGFVPVSGDRVDSALYNVEEFEFIDRINRRGCKVIISKINDKYTYWNPDITSGITNLITSGDEEHQGIKYKYGVFPVQGDDGQCFLVKMTGRTAGGKLDIMLKIIYYEYLDDSSSQCLQGGDKQDGLDNAQQTKLKQFMDNSIKNIRIIDLAQIEP